MPDIQLSMKMLLRYCIIVSLLLSGYIVNAQDTLPSFTVKYKNGKVILSWVNNFKVIKQLSIQRSHDSTKGFKTILTVPDPSSITNGFLDNNAPDTVSFYKLYILLDSGKYVFSKAHKPHKDVPPPPPVVKKETQVSVNSEPVNTVIVNEATPKSYGPELANVSNKKRSDGLKADSVNMVRPENFKPSGFIFTNPQGNVTVVLPIGKNELFKIKFFDSNGDELFELNNIKENTTVLDKSNFMRAGVYRFELYENGVLREKNKLVIPKDPTIR